MGILTFRHQYVLSSSTNDQGNICWFQPPNQSWKLNNRFESVTNRCGLLSVTKEDKNGEAQLRLNMAVPFIIHSYFSSKKIYS